MLEHLTLELRRLIKEKSGAISVMAAIFLIVVLGAGSLGIDASNLFTTRTLLQNTADMTVRAAVQQLPNSANVIAKANLIADQSMPQDTYGDVLVDTDIQIGTWNSATKTFTPSQDGQGTAVRVITRRLVEFSVAQALGFVDQEVSAKATAIKSAQFETCLLALKQIDTGILISGNVIVNMPNCSIAANSNASDSLRINGATSSITVQAIHVSGGIVAQEGVLNVPEGNIMTEQDPLPDPFASLPKTFAGLTERYCTGSGTSCTGTMLPGHYGQSIRLKGTITMSPGLYYFDSSVDIDASTIINGTGVTIVFDDNLKLASNNVRFNINAPTGNPGSLVNGIQGVALYGIGPFASVNLNAAQSTLNGAIYVPQGYLDIGGNGALAGCAQIVAANILLRGTPTLRQNCTGVPAPILYGGEPMVVE